MASTRLTEYERKRLENIRRNGEMISSLNLHSVVTQLNASTKRHRNIENNSSDNAVAKRKAKDQNPIVQRESSRTRGIPPDFKGIPYRNQNPKPKSLPPRKDEKTKKRLAQKSGRISMDEVYTGEGSDRAVIEAIVRFGSKSELVELELGGNGASKDENLNDSVKREGSEFGSSSLRLDSMALNPDNVRAVLTGAISALRFFPCGSSRMVVAGNWCGDVGIWNVDSGLGEEDAVNSYSPHTGPISGISIHQHCLSKVFTSSWDGFISLMDAEKEVFDFMYSGKQSIYSLSQQPNDMKCLYFGEGQGSFNIWDERAGKCTTQRVLHKMKVKSIDFNSQNPYIMATSSSDRTACIWDLRSINADKPRTLRTVSLERSAHSAYFSPSGKCLAITSAKNKINLLGGVDFEETSTMKNINEHDKSFPWFSAIWGWDDSHVFIGNSARRIDVISPAQRRPIFSFKSPCVPAAPYRLEAHPYNVGTLAGASTGGLVYVWMSS